MKITKYTNVGPENIDKIGSDWVVHVDDSHYIGSFLSNFQIAPIGPDGLRYNVISGVNLNSPDLNAIIHSVPLGVSNEPESNLHPRAFRYKGFLAYENLDGVTELNLYAMGELVGKITEISSTDKLILITNNYPDCQEYHTQAKNPHEFSTKFLTQSTIQEFSTVSKNITLSNKMNLHGDNIFGAFGIIPPFKPVKLRTEYIVSSSGTISKMDIYKEFDQPICPALESKFI